MKKVILAMVMVAVSLVADNYTCEVSSRTDLNTGQYEVINDFKIFMALDEKVDVLMMLDEKTMYVMNYYKSSKNKLGNKIDSYTTKTALLAVYDNFSKGAFLTNGEKRITITNCTKID